MNSNLSFPIPNSELPQGWHWVKLGEVCEVVTGATPRTDDPNNWDGEILWATPNDMGKLRGYIIEDTERKISHKGFESCSTKLLPPGSILLTTRAPIGHLAINLKPMCTNQGFKSLIPSSQIHNWFLFFVLKYFVPVLQSMGRGQTFTEISKGQVETFGIPLPPLPEQKRIATRIQGSLQEVKHARTACEKQLEATKALPTAYLREVFESEESKKWENRRLGEVCEIVTGSTPKTDDPSNWNGEILWATPNDMGKLREFTIEDTERKISQKGFESCSTKLLPPESVLLTTRAPIGHLAINLKPMCTNQGFKSLIPTSKIYNWFLFFALKHFVPVLQSMGRGQTFTEISKGQVETFEIPIPHHTEQYKIATYLKEKMAQVENLQSAIRNQLSALNTLPQAILRQAFNGEL
jgi:type I restriction enzyme S subunit